MTLSLNEVQAQAFKAARGAGYAWGLAEEAGKATRWLCGQGLDGVALLVGLLDAAPDPDQCPLTQGAWLSDQAASAQPESHALSRITAPVFVIPSLANIALMQAQILKLTWDGGDATTDGVHLALNGALPKTADLGVATGTATEWRALTTRAAPEATAWQTLGQYAHRTYAPATEESRRLGAGES